MRSGSDDRIIQTAIGFGVKMGKVCTKVETENFACKKLPFLTVDYLQLACLGGHSIQIEIQENGILFGKVMVWQGEIWSAHQGPRQGHTALAILVLSIASQVHNLHLEDDPGPRNIKQSPWQKILLESSLCLDENCDEGSETPLEPDLDSPLADLDFQELENQALDAMLDKRYADAWPVLEYAHAQDPNNRRVEANLARLRLLGYGGKK